MPTLTPAQARMLERIRTRGPILEMSLIGSGGSALRNLRALVGLGLVEAVNHPSVKDRRTGDPALAYAATKPAEST